MIIDVTELPIGWKIADLKNSLIGTVIPMKIESLSRIEDVPWCASYPVVSEKVKDAIDPLCDGVEWIPVRFVNPPTNTRLPNYFLLRCRAIVECHDEERSQFSIRENRSYIAKFFLDPERVPKGLNIFRAKYYEGPTIVSEDIKKLIEQLKVLRPSFKSPDWVRW